MDYCESIDNHALVPAQLPLLVEFLSAYRLADQLKALSVRDAKQAVPPFPAEVEDVDASLRSTIDTVYLLTRCLYYQSLPPPRYLKLILRKCNQEWTESSYNAIVTSYRRFTRRIDLQLLGAFEQYAKQHHVTMQAIEVSSFALTEEDRARYYALSSFSNAEIRLRLYLIQYYNAQLKKVVHLVDLGGSKESDANTLGSYISLLTGYIFPSVKENFLELSIVQTVYQGKDSCPGQPTRVHGHGAERVQRGGQERHDEPVHVRAAVPADAEVPRGRAARQPGRARPSAGGEEQGRTGPGLGWPVPRRHRALVSVIEGCEA